MTIIGWMITRAILLRFFAILVGVSLFVLTLEIIAYIKDILALAPDDPNIVFKYFRVRFPGVLATFLPISMLLAVLLALSGFSQRNESTAIWAAGVSPARMIRMLLPLGLFVGGLHFLLIDQIIPANTPRLIKWGIGDYSYKKLGLKEHDPIWLRAGHDILRAAHANSSATMLDDVVIFRRDAHGLLIEQIFAARAQLVDKIWVLSDVSVYYADNFTSKRLNTMIYTGTMQPASVGSRSGNPAELSLTDLNYFISHFGFGIKPVWIYKTWWHKRLTLFLTALLMIAICVPFTAHFRRGGGMGPLFALGVGLGFLFFIVDGIAMTMGELGFVAPWLAAWTPAMLFGAIALVNISRSEHV